MHDSNLGDNNQPKNTKTIRRAILPYESIVATQ
jgi:hypothetical protein